MRPESGRRYPDLERKFVSNVCRRAGMLTNGKGEAVEKLVDHVCARLDKGAEEYGAIQFWQVPLIGEKTEKTTPLICELQEEAADILGWGSLLNIRFHSLGWTDIATRLEVATTGVISYGNQLKSVEKMIENRTAR